MSKWSVKKLKFHVRILFLIAISMCLISCLDWILVKPSFTLRGITLNTVSFTAMNVLLNIDVRNPNSFDLTLKSFEYTIYLKNEEIGNGHLEKELLIPSSSTTQILVPIVVRFKDLNGSLKVIFTENDLPYKIEGNADVVMAFRSLKFPFSTEGRIDLKN